MKVLSLYDGMACGRIALAELGIKVEAYDAYEIDKYAIKAATSNFPDIVEHGDVFKGDFTAYEGVDFLMGGSPCTYWSIAQSSDKRETTASGLGWDLFCQYVRALEEARPRYFIYENNRSMSDAIRDSIRVAFGFDEVLINSALVSAQNRQRYYWVGKRNERGGYDRVDVRQPKDLGILLKDILETGELSEYKLNRTPSRERMWGNGKGRGSHHKCVNITKKDKSNCVTTKQDRNNNTGLIEYEDFCRYVTTRECARLQTIPDWYKLGPSRQKNWHMIGNGWTIRVIMHLIQSALSGRVVASSSQMLFDF